MERVGLMGEAPVFGNREDFVQDCQPGGGNTDFMRKDWQQSKRCTRQVTTPSVNFSKLTAIGCHFDCLYL